MSKHDILTEEELAAFELQRALRREIESDRARIGKEAHEIRILDWGCGRGRSVARLRELGYAAYGIDIDSRVIANGAPLFRGRGLDPDELLVPLDDVERLQSDSFDVIFSEEVFEHVSDVGHAVDQIWRLTKPGGVGIHRYPGALNVQEGHLFMPLVHWTPKNRLRRALITGYQLLGVGPRDWPEAEGKGVRERSGVYWRYSVDKTFYRRTREMRSLLEDRGFLVRVPPPRGLRRFLPAALGENGFPRGSVTLLTRKSAG